MLCSEQANLQRQKVDLGLAGTEEGLGRRDYGCGGGGAAGNV